MPSTPAEVHLFEDERLWLSKGGDAHLMARISVAVIYGECIGDDVALAALRTFPGGFHDASRVPKAGDARYYNCGQEMEFGKWRII